MSTASAIDTETESLTRLAALYRDLHEHPELSFEEHRTAAVVAGALRELGYEVTEGVGGTGVVGVLERGEGPVVMLRADMDALPVTEETGLAYASRAVVERESGATGVMHACGHDLHTTALLGAAGALAQDASWAGRVVLVFQPAEERGAGARAMVEDGLIERFGRPSVVLGQHVAPLPAGVIGLRSGPSFAASDSLKLTVHGRGGHGSRPETTVDPIVLAAAIVTRLQSVVSREVAATDMAVVTVGSFHAGEAANIIPDRAELALSVRTFDPAVRTRVLEAISRIANGEAAAAGAAHAPEMEFVHSFPAVNNDADAVARTRLAFEAALGRVTLVDPGVVTGSEDVGLLAEAAGAPLVYWLLGGADPAAFAGATDVAEIARIVASLPSNHSPQFAPVIDPTLRIGLRALHVAATGWLGRV